MERFVAPELQEGENFDEKLTNKWRAWALAPEH